MRHGYCEIRPLEDRDHSIFGTIELVAKRIGISKDQMIYELGFDTIKDIIDVVTGEHVGHFSLDQYFVKRFNAVLRNHHIPLRITPRYNQATAPMGYRRIKEA